MNVPLCDLKAQYDTIEVQVQAAIQQVLDNGNYVMGREVEQFEQEWAAFCRAKYCVGVSSGTDALYLALEATKTEWGRWIITTPTTFFATTQAILFQDTPHFIDIDKTGNLPDQDFGDEWALPVNLYGYPGNWRGKHVIVDAAQSHGVPLKGELCHCHSFYPTKNLGAMGQAGAIVTNDEGFYKAIKELRTYGERERFVHYALTGNHRMDEMQAAILSAKLPYLREWNLDRRHRANIYRAMLKEVKGIVLPVDHIDHTYHIFAIRCKERDALANYLKERGIQTAVRYPVPMHQQPAIVYLCPHEHYPEAEALAKENLSLPMYPELPLASVKYVCQCITEWSNERHYSNK